MMPELSLNILDVVQNSISAGASLINITVQVSYSDDTLTITISDNGCGMTKDILEKVNDPFFTTRTTRNVGLGIPFLSYAAKSTGGTFSIQSTLGKGTKVTAIFGLSHIDRMPLGDMVSTIHALITLNTHIDFIYTYEVNQKSFTLNTKQMREILGNVPFSHPEVSGYIKDFLKENQSEVDEGNYI